MKTGRTIAWVVAAGAALFAGAVVWPQKFETVWPGWGVRAVEIRHALPEKLTAALPAYPETPAAGTAQTAATGGAKPGQAGGGRPAGPPAPVIVTKVARGPMPVRIDAVGTVQPIASVALKTRIDATIDTILVGDGSRVKAGDVLVRLDDRQVQAQIKAAEAALAKDQVALEQNQRDMQRYQDLLTKGAGTQLNFDNARTSLAATRAQIMGDQAQLDNLKVQLGWYTISAPIAGRVGTFAAKAGNIVRAGDNTSTGTLATIVQTTPIYVSFSVPQALLSDLRETLANQSKGAEVLATPQGATRAAHGKISVLDNTIDSGTGTISVRATFPNEDEFLWPGQLCNVRVVVRIDPQAVSIPRSAMQSGQNGNFVYVIENGVAKVRPVTLSRTQDDVDVVAEGLQGGETIVIDGALMLVDGARVEVRTADARKGAI